MNNFQLTKYILAELRLPVKNTARYVASRHGFELGYFLLSKTEHDLNPMTS